MVNEKYPNCPIDVFAKRTSLYGAYQTMFAWLLMMTSSILLQVCETWQLPQINGAIGTPEKSYQRLEDKICELQRSVQNVEASNVAKAEDLFGRGPEKDPRLRSVSCCWSHVVKPKIPKSPKPYPKNGLLLLAEMIWDNMTEYDIII